MEHRKGSQRVNWFALMGTLTVCSIMGCCNGFIVTQHTSSLSSSLSIRIPGGAQPKGKQLPSPLGRLRNGGLAVFWSGGNGGEELGEEVVAVRIDRTSANSRRICGDIIVPTPLADVWAILTDYNRLSIHVPNLVESKIVSSNSQGQPGDGSYKCRLYQKGAQKIAGFEFGADLTMDMTERVMVSSNGVWTERSIGFKCIDSFFFREFDGAWKVQELPRSSLNGLPQTKITYTVDVRPKGPVPVAVLEWRIREDVPTNLRAVKRAAMIVGRAGVGHRHDDEVGRGGGNPQMHWLEDETMAAYLKG